MAHATPDLAIGVPRPFAYRVLGPYTAGLLPIPAPTAFYVLALAGSALLLVMLLRRMRAAGLDSPTALTTTALFALNPHFFGFSLWDYFQVADVLALVLIAAAWWAMERGRWAAFGLALWAGALTKEPALLMPAVAVVFLRATGRLSSSWRALALSVAPAVVTFIAVRQFVPVAGGLPLAVALAEHADKLRDGDVLWRLTVNAFAPLGFVPLVCWPDTVAYFRRRPHAAVFLALVGLGALFGTDNERLLAPAFIVFYPLIGRLAAVGHWPRWMLPGLLALSAATAFGGRGEPGVLLPTLTSVGAAAVVAVSLLAQRRGRVDRQALARGKARGPEADTTDDGHDAADDERIRRTDAEEQAGDEPAGGERARHADEDARRHGPAGFGEEQPEHLRALRAERHPDVHLPPPS
jgi:hypothetical protein